MGPRLFRTGTRVDGFNDVWALRRDLAWFVGDDGRVFRWNGDDVVAEVLGPDIDLTSATSWEVGRQVELHSVWASSDSDVWVVGSERTVLHFDGTAWTSIVDAGLANERDFVAVRGAGPDDVWVSGDMGLWHWDGASWSRQQYPLSEDFITGLAVSSDELIVMSTGRDSVRRDSEGWHEMPRIGWDGQNALSRTEQGGVWAAGDCSDFGGCRAIASWDGARWRREQEGSDRFINAIWAGDGAGPWAVTSYGQVLQKAPR